MKKIAALLLAAALVLALTACSSGGGDGLSAGSDTAPGRPDWVQDNGASGSLDTEEGAQTPGGEIYRDSDAKIIRTAEVTIQTLDFDRAVEALAALTEENGGYYESARVDSGSYYDSAPRRSATYVVRVPRENFDAFHSGAEGVGHVYSYTENARDVGEEYYDTEARLETLETKRERLLELLEQADVMEDIIALEGALADVQYEIDQHTTTLRRYDSLIGYSTFTVYLNEVARIQEDPWTQEGFGARLLANLREGFAAFGDGVQSAVFWLARNLIAVVLLAAAVTAGALLLRRWRRRRRAGRIRPGEGGEKEN